ncbi:MAG TPA: hypothetical protein VL691_18530 [Vicinamibacteria bacterium]|nr:hypothetical protein [Vicinamibacteria bacterium]
MTRTPVVAGRTPIALVTALALALAPSAPLVAEPSQASSGAAPSQAKAAPPPQAKGAATAATAPAKPAAGAPASTKGQVDGGWPRAYSTPSGGRIIVYQPQVASWPEQRRMTAYAAVSYEAKGATKAALGSIKIEADTKVAPSERLVRFSSLQITESNFPTVKKEEVREVVTEIDKAIPDDERVIALDRVLASVDKSQILPRNAEGVKADPPKIFFSDRAAVLVNLDGDVIWSPIRDNDLKFAVNTNWDLFQHRPTNTFYLRNEKTWLKATDLAGPWTPAGKLPESFSKLPVDDNWKDVKAAVPGEKIAADKAPRIFVSTTPAEMILLDGPPRYKPVTGTGLTWVSNTESDVFRMGQSGTVYYLVAGRWFSAPGFDGPWTFATPTLPVDFQKISLEHPRSRVLAAVPGTQQAAEAVLLAQVPQTARVKRKELKAPEVQYQGEPKFEPIEKTTISHAVNTDKQIFKVGDLYYMCFQGVWFMAKGAGGPWEVTSSVPKQIYEIPASSSDHNVTYVTVVEEDSDDEWVAFATVAAYTGLMIAWGCAVWGTGYYHPPYWGMGPMYPYYYPRYPTYGYGAWYNPWSGAYGRSAVAYGPYGGAGVSARYNPRTGTYSRGAAAWGPYGARGYGEAYNPRTGAYGQTRQGSNVYGSWGTTSVQRGDQWATTSRVTSNRTGNTARVTRGSEGGTAITKTGPGGSGGVARSGSGDVYAGRDGNVYRNQGGSWQKYDNGSWGNVETPQRASGQAATTQQARDRASQAGAQAGTAQARDRSSAAGPTSGATSASSRRTDSATMDQLNRDSRARSDGAQRTRDYSNYQRSGGSRSSASSYRPSGGSRGGARGGGGRRR